MIGCAILRFDVEATLQLFDQGRYDLHAEGLTLLFVNGGHTRAVVLDANIELMSVGIGEIDYEPWIGLILIGMFESVADELIEN